MKCRMAALRLSCVRQHRWLGVLQYVASVKEYSPVKSGGAGMGRRALAGSVPHTLPASQLDQAGRGTNSIQSSGARHGFGQLCDYGSTYCDGNSDDELKCRSEICVNRKEKVSNFFLWAGKQSLEIYMMHGLLLNIFKNSIAIQFSSIEGYLLTAGNFALTVGLCAVVIRLLDQNAVLKKVLNIR